MQDREAEILAIASNFPEEPSSVSGFLRAVQAKFNWLPPESLEWASERFKMSYPRVYEEASLSPDLCTEERGRTVIAVCRGLACSEAFAKDVLKDWELALGLRDGQTGQDGNFSLCTQNCFGRCAIGPNVRIKQSFFSGQAPGMAALHLKSL